ncbi:MAG TPA: hypothetical protein VJ840_15030, partial [Gemmatimonadaceae bacterium]|nr:hypothetical protein [Gemmatimonadaceae bacterium]
PALDPGASTAPHAQRHGQDQRPRPPERAALDTRSLQIRSLRFQGIASQPTKSANMAEWQSLIEQATQSSKVLPWSSGSTETWAYLSRIGGKWFVVQVDRTTGDLVTAFVPSSRQLTAMLRILGG